MPQANRPGARRGDRSAPSGRPAHYRRHRRVDLSPRQREVLDLIAAGHTNAQIGEQLGISLDGAKYHVSEVLAKLDVGSREAAVIRWREYNSPSQRLRRAFYHLLPPISLKISAAAAGAVAAAAIAGAVYVAASEARHGREGGAPTPAATALVTAAPAPVVTGESTEILSVGGSRREAVVYVPARLSAAKAPAIIYLTATGMERQPVQKRFGVGFDAEADRLGFVAVWAEGSPALPQGDVNIANNVSCCYWDNGTTTWDTGRAPDDIAFFQALLDLLVKKYPVDPNRISFAGAAGGAAMTYRLACELGDRIAAIADVSSTHRDNSECPNPRPVSLILMLGTANPLVPFGGGVSPNRATGPPVPPVNDVIDYWRRVDGCTGAPAVTMLTAQAEQRRYSACKASEVVLITVKDGDNAWWGAPFFGPAGDPDLHATPIVAEFLTSQSRTGR